MFKATVLLCCSVFAGAASAQQQQFGEWRFQVPSGWQFQLQGDAALLAPSDVAPGAVYIKLFPGQPLDGDLQIWLETQAMHDSQGLNVVQNTSVVPFKSRPGAFQKIVGTQAGDGHRSVRMYVAESPAAGRAELFLFYGEIPTARNYTAAMATFSNSVRFAAAGSAAQGSTATPQPSRMDNGTPSTTSSQGGILFSGWWVRSMPRTVPGPNFTFTMRPAWEYYRFFPNGWVYTSFPVGGDLDSVTCPQAGIAEGKCERFTLNSNMITIGRERAKTLAMISADEIKISEVATWRLRPITIALSGTYEAVSGGGGLGTASLTVSEVTFFPNGTFSSSRTSAINSTTTGSSASAYRNAGGSGRYAINGYNLQLNYSNGQAITTKVLAPAGNDADLLVIGSSTYVKKSTK